MNLARRAATDKGRRMGKSVALSEQSRIDSFQVLTCRQWRGVRYLLP
jgi:hypothetical protein